MRTRAPDIEAMLTLAELIATRLCHDLAGLCGTVLSALDLAVEDAQSVPEALPLAHDTAIELAARLRLLRAAWGASPEPLDQAALRELAAGLPGATRLQLDFAGLAAATPLPPDLSRLALNALLLAAGAVPGGGTLRLSGDATSLAIAIEGRRAAWPDSLAGLIAAPHTVSRVAQEAGSRGVLPPLLVLLAQDAAAGLRLDPVSTGGPAILRIERAPGTPDRRDA